MRALIAEDDPVSRRLLQETLKRMGCEIVTTADGGAAWRALQSADAPQMAVLDWMMPEMDGVEVCRRVRRLEGGRYVYIILLTAKSQKKDIIAGLEAGADDYLIKPFDPQELRSRIAVGERILKLESALASNIRDLEQALSHVKQLQGLLPICMYCKKIRDDDDTWHRLETYIEKNTEAMFSHSLCEDCLREHYPKQSEKIARDRAATKT